MKTISSEILPPRCERFPILINLKRYAAWLNKQEEGKSRSVISYVLSLINGKANASLSIHDFRRLLSGHSWVFLFDGLDEVPASSNRNETLKQIQEFLEKDLTESSCDSLVICTSRPQGYDYAFSTYQYNHYELKDMSKPLCKDYIDKLLRYMEENSEKREDYRKILHIALDDPMVSKLMTTPLYTAIIVLLVKMGSTPPSKRYSLFEDYCKIVIKRELQKEMLPLLNKEYDWVETLHAQIGFLLQSESESAENAAAELSSSRCKEIITGYLRDEEFNGDLSKKTEEFYQAITRRLSFLSEVSSSEQETCVIFPLRSLQEYFAAKWLLSFDDDDRLSDALEIISVSAYWRNVYLFVAGFFAKNRNRKNMNEELFRICQRNNGDENYDSPNAAVHRIALQGSWLALDLLCDNLFSRLNDQRRYLNIAAELLDWDHYTTSSTKRFFQLPSSVANIFLEEKVIPYLEKTKKAESIAFEFLWGMANSGNQQACVWLEALIGDITLPSPITIYRLLSYGFDNIGEKTLLTVFRWITENYFGDFCLKSRFSPVYWNFLSYLFTHSQDMEPSLPAIRQAAYKILHRRYFKQKMENVFWPHPLIREMLSDNRLNNLLAYPLPKASNLKYKPICRSFSKIPLKEYAETFHSYGLNELSALMEFLDSPSYESLNNLFAAYRDLPENCKDSFIELMEQYNWLLQEIADSLLSSEREEDVFSRYDSEYFEICLAKDRELAALIEAEDLISITKSNYWNKISISIGMTIPPDMIRKLLNNTNKDNINNSFLSILYEAAMSRKRSMPELLQFGMDNFPLLFQTFYGVQLALTLFEKASLNHLTRGDIDYPKTMQITGYIYFSDGEERAGNLLKKIDKLVGAEFFQAYALLPYFYNCINPEALLKLSPDTMRRHYDNVKATGNPAAVLGCILRVLTGPVSDEQKGMIREDLLKLLPIRSFAHTLYQEVESFSIDGKVTLYEAINALGAEMSQSVNPLGMVTHIILEELESSPVDRNRLMCLSKAAHSDWNFC